jgi:hypothetical protein
MGCYQTVPITKQQLVEAEGRGEVRIVTKDSEQYRFTYYTIRNDTLFGKRLVFGAVHSIPSLVAIPISEITVVEVERFDGVKTAFVVGATALAVAGLVAILSSSRPGPPPPPPPSSGTGGKMSCPFVYTYDGKAYQLESETFAGAVFKGIERASYDILYHLKPVDGAYHLKLVNARNETEYTNELKLIVIDHPTGTTIIPDRAGVIHSLKIPELPLRCMGFDGKDALNQIVQKDDIYWESDISGKDFNEEQTLRDGLILEFKKPAGAGKAKLVVNGTNTRLGYFALENIFKLKGEEKLQWYQQLNSDPAERAKFVSWIMREGMLHVHVWHDGRWVERAALLDVGPGIAKDQVALLDVSDIAGDVLKIKLESTTDLWRIDQAYVDYSADVSVSATELSAQRALNEQGHDVAELLSTSDEKYYVTISDQYADLTFRDVPLQPGTERSYVVKTKGFYIEWFKANGPANNELVERILTEPSYGSKVLMGKWLSERNRYEGISEAR